MESILSNLTSFQDRKTYSENIMESAYWEPTLIMKTRRVKGFWRYMSKMTSDRNYFMVLKSVLL